jgi:multidrug efflux pump subunit AcrA (membrane-fusion protein)
VDNLFVIIGLTSFLGGFVGFVMLLIRKYRSKGWKVLLACCVAFGVSGYVLDGAQDRDAQSAGYVNAEDQELAAELGYTSAEDWAADRDRILEERAQQREAEARAAAEEYQRRQAQAEQERLEAEAAERARLEAERLAEETAAQSAQDRRRAEMAAKTSAMTESIVATVQSHYGVEAQALLPGSPFCRDDGYCFLTVGPFDVEVYGAGLAVVKTTNQASRTDYVEMCGVVFAAISGSDIMFAGQVVGETYGAALRDGSFERDVSNIEIKISPSSDGILGCQFFKY